jgi:diguanylate cyclase (GGDEF)-like protein
MKHSLKKIFTSLRYYLFFVFFVALFGVLVTLEQQLSFDKIDNLKEQKQIVNSLTQIKENDFETTLIEFNAQSTRLLQNVDKLKTIYKYDFSNKFILNNDTEYLQDLKYLSFLAKKFNKTVKDYYLLMNNKEKQELTLQNIKNSRQELLLYIDSLLIKNIIYNEEKFQLIKTVVFILFFIILFATFYFTKTLRKIYKDIDFLLHVDRDRRNHNLFTKEADAISLRMKRKNLHHDNPDMLDHITEINNYKGLLYSYANKKGLKESNITSVTVLEVDNFSKNSREFPEETKQAILRKIAYTISLYELPVDVIARTEYNQFTVVLSRPTKELALKEMESIRESIAELKFNIPNIGPMQITVTGGFLLKPSNTSLEEAIRKAKEILKYGQQTAINKIFQNRDIGLR